MDYKTLAALLSPQLMAIASVAIAETTEHEQAAIDEVVVLGQSVDSEFARIAVAREPAVDTAAILARLPGADANHNGPITGIASYRGMYGDRVSVSVDGLGIISGGPNAMDTPLSYVSPMITEELVLERGIPGVASAPETIGGHIKARLARGKFGSQEQFGLAGMAGMRYSPNGDASITAARVTAANRSHRVSLVAEFDRADDFETPQGTIVPSGLSRDRYDLSYAYSDDETDVLFFAGRLDTVDTGTPALPMDIRYIDTAIYGAQFGNELGRSWSISAKVGYNDVDHLMDNFALRAPPAMPMQYRQNHTAGSGTVFDLAGRYDAGDYVLQIGLDGRLAEHESIITNPNSPQFFVNNFVNLERDTFGTYTVLNLERQASKWELGVRYNRVVAATGAVSSAGMMPAMQPLVDELAASFNATDRSQDYGNVDIVAKYRRALADVVDLHVNLGSKARAPSYQELYLWLPLPATGGLADGRSYIGNPALLEERSNEISIGIDWSGARFRISPQAYFKDVSDYIQGVASSDSQANMLAMMMSGQAALEFSNVDAEIYGLDLGWQYRLSDSLQLDGTVAYTRGKRTDVPDNLYRLPPLNASIGINYSGAAWAVRGELLAFDGQDKVSAYNGEQASAGYAVVNGLVTWNATEQIRFELQASNLLDSSYQAHLAGVNRARGGDMVVGERVFGIERTLTAGLIVTF
jgi:iron complex outermembrane receptor protein